MPEDYPSMRLDDIGPAAEAPLTRDRQAMETLRSVVAEALLMQKRGVGASAIMGLFFKTLIQYEGDLKALQEIGYADVTAVIVDEGTREELLDALRQHSLPLDWADVGSPDE